MAVLTSVDPWQEIRDGRADQAGANIYWLYCAVQKNDFKLIAVTLKSIIKNEDWKRWRWIGQEFECSSLRECLLRHPPNGIGADLKLLRRVIYDDKEALDKLDRALQNPVGSNQYPDQASLPVDEGFNNVKGLTAPVGNSIEYALRRLRADDRPIAKELHAKVLAGQLSAHRAAVLAGYRKESTPFEIVRKQLSKLTLADCETLLVLIEEEMIRRGARNQEASQLRTRSNA